MRTISEKLRAPSNWLRQDKGAGWKDVVNTYDRAPFESADTIDALVQALKAARNTMAANGLPKIAAQICDAALARAEARS